MDCYNVQRIKKLRRKYSYM